MSWLTPNPWEEMFWHFLERTGLLWTAEGETADLCVPLQYQSSMNF